MVKRGQEEILQELMQTFQVEAQEHLRTLNQSLLALERVINTGERTPHLQTAFRAAHSLKGAARAVNIGEIERLSHAIESLLQQARDQGRVLDADTCDVLYTALDTIGDILHQKPVDPDALLERLLTLAAEPGTITGSQTPQSPPQAGEGPAAASLPTLPASDGTIRVSIRKLDDLMAQMGELLVSRISAEQHLTSIRMLREQLDQWRQTWQPFRTRLLQVKGDNAASLHAMVEQHTLHIQHLTDAFEALTHEISRDTLRLAIVTDELQEQVRYVRMIPFQNILLPLERTVRDLSHSEAKPVQFVVRGGEIELDRKVLETLKDPLLHLLRNAVGHGIEPKAARAAAGKPETGQITLTIQQRGSEVRLLLEDDGRGFDLDGLMSAYQRQQANGATSESAPQMRPEEIIALAFQPGITTSSEVTALSGRGMGLDIVRQDLEALQGRLRVESRVGLGTTIEMIVPSSLTMTRGLVLQVGDETYLLPLHAVEKILPAERIRMVSGQPMFELDSTMIPLAALAQLLDQPTPSPAAEPAQSAVVLVIAVADQRLALLVEDVVAEQEVAVKPLASPFVRVRNVAGTAMLGSGEPIIVLNAADMIRSARGARLAVPAGTLQPMPSDESEAALEVLVVDDSITTRTLEKNILEAAGFVVTTAINGVEALKKLREHAVHIVVSDVQMPEMNGLELVRQIRQSKAHQHLPVILVTSLESSADREEGRAAGADAYIVKRGFDQAELLATIARLIGRTTR